MKLVKLFVFTLIVALCVLASIKMPVVKAQDVEVSGPLAGAPAVMQLRIYRESRFQIKAHTTMTLQDQFNRAILFGGQLAYHLWDFLGIGVWGGFAPVQIQTGLTDEIVEKGQTNERNVLSLPSRDGFPDQIGKLVWVAAPQVMFIPLRGKLGLFEELFVDTDFSVFGGVAFVGVEERSDVDRSTCAVAPPTPGCLNSQSARSSRMTIAPTFGVGLSLYIIDSLAMTIEWRGLPFAWNSMGTDESGDFRGDFPDKQISGDDHLFRINHMVSLGFAFYLPLKPKISHTD